jgi:hypothetical protein
MLVNLDFGSPFSFETLTIGSATIPFSSNIYYTAGLPPKKAMLQLLNGGQLRYRIDGLALVTSTLGHVLNPYDSLIVDGIQAIRNFSSVAVTSGTPAVAMITYFR